VDPQTRLASAVAQPESISSLVPGSAVRARIVIAAHTNALTVPRAAVLYTDEQPFVFVAEGGKARRRPVTTGLVDDTRIEILKGLKAGESVVVGGNYELDDGMAVQLAAADKSDDDSKDDAKGEPKLGADDAKDDAKGDPKPDAKGGATASKKGADPS
jgi:multidrug efflux pump subunit AcrA (membrane-fusion protein)